jgi:hypothetical protein
MKQTIYSSFAFSKRSIILFFVAVFLSVITVNAQPYTAFNPGSDFPAGGAFGGSANTNDPGPEAIETGVKFKVSQPGFINGVRFYKGNSNTGTHIGQLWNVAGGAPLKTVTFTGESATGWQQMNFATGYHVGTGTILIASVYMPTGTYAVTGGYFSGPLTNDGITLLCNCDGTSPNNGVFDYTTTGALTTPPTNNFGGANYWIDVSFVPDFSLPVSLSDFRATTANSDVLLSWKTDHEFNNRGFEIQRSNNGADWYAVNFVNGAGDGTTTRNYSYTDKGLAPGTYYYRLNQSDIDGKNTFSAIVTATISGKGKVSLFQNYPNPFSGSTKIRFDLPETQHARLTLADLSGREVKVLTDKLSEAGSHVITLDASNLRPQVYLVTLRTATGVLTKKISVK